ncbi:MAG TPA: HdeA/HdeB family chaperone [Devosiaceae bacterium]|jgi:hypothetical protein|nr:HdeA/HdeB family chaperone [Devosiaceae bacterium]
MTSPASALAIVAGLLAAGPAAAQVGATIDSRNSPSALRCSALAELNEAERPAAIYFLAGYASGERDATAFATVGPTDTLGIDTPEEGSGANDAGVQQPDAPALTPEEDEQFTDAGPTGGPPAAILPTVPVEAVLAACGQSPDSRIIDMIITQSAVVTN